MPTPHLDQAAGNRGEGLWPAKVVIEDSPVDRAIDATQHAAHSGMIGDGKIFVSTIEEVIRIRTGEK
jgi:nitrogen regulatory protein PII